MMFMEIAKFGDLSCHIIQREASSLLFFLNGQCESLESEKSNKQGSHAFPLQTCRPGTAITRDNP